MSSGDSGVDYSFPQQAERVKRTLAIRIIVALSAAGIIIVFASWLSG